MDRTDFSADDEDNEQTTQHNHEKHENTAQWGYNINEFCRTKNMWQIHLKQTKKLKLSLPIKQAFCLGFF